MNDISASNRATDGSTQLAVGRATSFLKLLAHEGRLEIMCLLIDGGRTVGEIEASLGLSQSAVSQQLMRLRAEGLVVAHREGRSIRYVLGRSETVVVIRALQQAFCPPGQPGAISSPG
ncbi:MAG: winged helix-turn-helix transcriptional regulator [Tabrizicola sp.]|nr:winged helix-turn-helix transcriptional regulator [Tabrizicola sp.]